MHTDKNILLFLTLLIISVSGKLFAGDQWSSSWGESEGETEAVENVSPLYGYIETRALGSFDSVEAEWGHRTAMRLKGEWPVSEALTARMELSYEMRQGVVNDYVLAAGYGLLAYPSLESDNPQDDFLQSLELDHAWAVVSLGSADLSFGKMPLAWGTAWLFNPTDRLGARSGLQDREAETPGIPALVAAWYPVPEIALEASAVFRQRGIEDKALLGSADVENIPFGLKAKAYIAGFDLSLSFIREVWYSGGLPLVGPEEWLSSHLLGLDLVGELGDVGIYLESAVQLHRDHWDVLDDVDLSTGVEYSMGGYDMKMEYIHNGSGESSKTAYDLPALLAGRQLFLSRNYLFLYCANTLGDYLDISASGLINLNDGSLVAGTEIAYPLLDNLEVSLSGSFPMGASGSEYNGEFDLGTGEVRDFMRPELALQLKASF